MKNLNVLLNWMTLEKFPYVDLQLSYTSFIETINNPFSLIVNDIEYQFLTFEEIIDYYESYNFKSFMEFALPFAMDGNSNFYIFDKRSNGNDIYLVASNNLEWDSEDLIFIGNDFNKLF